MQKTNTPIDIDQPSLDILARTMWGEARGEGVMGLRAVAHVVINRVQIARAQNGSWWGNTIIDVCRKPFQFSCWNPNDANYKRVQTIDARNPEFRVCRDLIPLVVATLPANDPTYGATHYHRYDMKPFWARGRTPVARIGAHVFYALSEEG